MDVMKYLEKSGVKYEVLKHKAAFTAQRMAAFEHEPGKYVAKPVIVKVDGAYMMFVLSASCKIDLRALKSAVGAEKVELANEEDLAGLFGDCELGAEPPFGNLYDLPTIMDKSLEADEHIVFQAGSHERAVRMSMSDYRELAEPKVLAFSYHTT